MPQQPIGDQGPPPQDKINQSPAGSTPMDMPPAEGLPGAMMGGEKKKKRRRRKKKGEEFMQGDMMLLQQQQQAVAAGLGWLRAS